MTSFGKILVLMNLGLSFLLGTWAVSLYINRVNWTTKSGKQDAEAVVKELRERIQKLQSQTVTPKKEWVEARRTLHQKESQRENNQIWFANQIELLQTGEGNLQRIEFVAGTSTPAMDPANPERPKMVPALDRRSPLPAGAPRPPLRSLRVYNDQSKDLNDEITKVLAEYNALAEKAKELTALLIGAKGLQERVKKEKAKLEGLQEEQTLVKPLLINVVVESRLILKRRRALEARIKELGAIPVKVAGR